MHPSKILPVKSMQEIDSGKQAEDNYIRKKNLAESMKTITTPGVEKSGRFSSSHEKT